MRAPAERSMLAAALLALAPACLAADGLGTLFHTPEERALLDKQRRGEPVEAVAATPAPPRVREVTGFVKRSDGRNTVWIDGQPVPTRAPKAGPLLDPSGVQGYADRKQDDLRVEVKPAR